MQLTVFGSTGETGRLLVEEATAAGHDVVAYARSPDKLDLRHPRLSVIAGTLDDADGIDRAVHGADAVISILGPRPRPRVEGTPIADGTRRIVAAMGRHGVSRLVATATPSAVDPADRASLRNRMIRTVVRVVIPHAYRDIVATADVVRSSALEWTLVRVPMLTSRESTSTPVAGQAGDPRLALRLSRNALADFLLAQLEDDAWIGRSPMLGNGRNAH